MHKASPQKFHAVIAASLAVAVLLLAAIGCQNNPDGGQAPIIPGHVNGVPYSQLDNDTLNHEARRLAVREDQLKEIRDLRRQNDSQISPYLVPNSFESSELEKIQQALREIKQEKKKRGI